MHKYKRQALHGNCHRREEMKKIIALTIALLLVAIGVSACPKQQGNDKPAFVAVHASHFQVLAGKSRVAYLKGLLMAAARSHGVVFVVPEPPAPQDPPPVTVDPGTIDPPATP